MEHKFTTLVETRSGEMVEVRAGTLCCENSTKNWESVAEWAMANEANTMLIRTMGSRMFVDLPDSPAHRIHSLLESFEHQ
jgi:hypothetical protein